MRRRKILTEECNSIIFILKRTNAKFCEDNGNKEDRENAEDFLRNWREPVFFLMDWCSEDWSVVMTGQRLLVFFG
jgi:hypothetical protein